MEDKSVISSAGVWVQWQKKEHCEISEAGNTDGAHGIGPLKKIGGSRPRLD